MDTRGVSARHRVHECGDDGLAALESAYSIGEGWCLLSLVSCPRNN